MPARLLVVLTVLVTLLSPAAVTAGPTRPPGPSAAAPPWGVPLPGDLTVTRPFEPPPHPFGPGHRGVDLAGTAGGQVVAAGDGVVAFAGMVAGRPLLSIDHAGNLRTTYEPVTPSVGAGQHVTRGSAIGSLLGGHAGCPVAACLHWGLRRGDAYLDPMLLLEPPRVRLLPMRPGPDLPG